MLKYKVAMRNHPENKVVVPFPDLLVKYSTGYMLPLKVTEGEYIPTQILDPFDVEKSLVVGSLGAYIKNGIVVVEDDEPKIEPKSVEVNKEPIPTSKVEAKPQEATQEVPTDVPSKPVESKQEELPQINLSQVKVADDFFRLSYHLKLRFIKDCTDKALLQQIASKLDPKLYQLKVNIQARLTQI